MNRYLYILILSMLSVAEAEAQEKAFRTGYSDTPRLVVNISIDQLRGDYLEQFVSEYGLSGFRKLLTEGIVYENASVPFLPVDRASASATLSTGALPRIDGIPAAEWLSRKTLAPVYCTDDQTSTLTSSGANPSPVNLIASTVGDELKIATATVGKVYSIAPECDAAVMLGGHCPDGVVWINSQTGAWTSSAYYTKTHPEWLTLYNKIYTPKDKLKSSAYSFSGETRYVDYKTSALVNQDVTNIALQCFSNTQLGDDVTMDILNIQYYAGTYKHQAVSDVSKELMDTYVRLDRALEKLVTTIEKRVGKKHVLFVVSSTGYFDEPVIDYSQYRLPSGTVYINRTASLLNMYLSAMFGQDKYVDTYKNNQIFLNHKVIEQKRLKLSEVLDSAREMLIMSDGISNAYTSLDLATSTSAETMLLHNSFSIDLCGDLVIETAPGWKLLDENTQKQQQWRQYGFAFPIVIYGGDMAHEVVTTPVTIDQIAPTISKSIRIRAPNACKSVSLH